MLIWSILDWKNEMKFQKLWILDGGKLWWIDKKKKLEVYKVSQLFYNIVCSQQKKCKIND